MDIRALADLQRLELQPLVDRSLAEGYRFVAKLEDEWLDGSNRFDRPGEALYGAWRDGAMIGVCGRNIDPYRADPGVARLRHLYVLPAGRRLGVGRALVERVVQDARGWFRGIALRTPLGDQGASAFYAAIGFTPVREPAATHFLVLPG
jgi:GNAT superfamily N-acetyltransferase